MFLPWQQAMLKRSGAGRFRTLQAPCREGVVLFNCCLFKEGWIVPLSITWCGIELLQAPLPPTGLFFLKLPQFVKVRAADPTLDPRAGERSRVSDWLLPPSRDGEAELKQCPWLLSCTRPWDEHLLPPTRSSGIPTGSS